MMFAFSRKRKMWQHASHVIAYCSTHPFLRVQEFLVRRDVVLLLGNTDKLLCEATLVLVLHVGEVVSTRL